MTHRDDVWPGAVLMVSALLCIYVGYVVATFVTETLDALCWLVRRRWRRHGL